VLFASDSFYFEGKLLLVDAKMLEEEIIVVGGKSEHDGEFSLVLFVSGSLNLVLDKLF